MTADFHKSQFVTVEIERCIDIGDADHRVQITHWLYLMILVRPNDRRKRVGGNGGAIEGDE